MADVRTSELVINKLSKQQYDNIQNPSNTELYLVPEDEEHKPICYPTTASEVTTTSMVVKSSVSDNGKILTENGFVYNTSGNPTISDTKVICDLGVGFFEKTLENLTMNTEYHIKSYGQNSSGLVYGSELVQRTTYTPIPDEYQLVEYIDANSTDNQFYTNDYAYNARYLKLEVEMSILGNGNGMRMFGASSSTHRVFTTNNLLYFDIKPSTRISTNMSVYFNMKKHYEFSNFYIAIDNTIVTSSSLLSQNNIFSAYGWFGESQRYYGNVRLTDTSTNTLLHCFYPVRSLQDSSCGFYDIVTSQYHAINANAVGPDKPWTD